MEMLQRDIIAKEFNTLKDGPRRNSYFSVLPQLSCMILNKLLRFRYPQVSHEKI